MGEGEFDIPKNLQGPTENEIRAIQNFLNTLQKKINTGEIDMSKFTTKLLEKEQKPGEKNSNEPSLFEQLLQTMKDSGIQTNPNWRETGKVFNSNNDNQPK